MHLLLIFVIFEQYRSSLKCVNLTYHFILIDEKVICFSITTKNVLKFRLRMMQVFTVHWIFIRLPLMQFLMHISLQFNAVASFIRISYFTRLYVSRFSCIYNRYISILFFVQDGFPLLVTNEMEHMPFPS